MIALSLVGIGTGNPDHLTRQGIAALNAADVILIPRKGESKADLAELRVALCAAVVTNPTTQIVYFDMPLRDSADADYTGTVSRWHDAIADIWCDSIRAHLRCNENVAVAAGEKLSAKLALLVWGDPSLYDSTLRIVDQIGSRGSLALDVEVIPGITSIQALTEQHRIPLNRIGEPVVITTGRLLAAGGPTITTTTVVMLDASCAFNTLEPDGIVIWWGAYLGTPDEILLSGPLVATGSLIEQVRAEARARKGWIMDIYVLQPSPSAT